MFLFFKIGLFIVIAIIFVGCSPTREAPAEVQDLVSGVTDEQSVKINELESRFSSKLMEKLHNDLDKNNLSYHEIREHFFPLGKKTGWSKNGTRIFSPSTYFSFADSWHSRQSSFLQWSEIKGEVLCLEDGTKCELNLDPNYEDTVKTYINPWIMCKTEEEKNKFIVWMVDEYYWPMFGEFIGHALNKKRVEEQRSINGTL